MKNRKTQKILSALLLCLLLSSAAGAGLAAQTLKRPALPGEMLDAYIDNMLARLNAKLYALGRQHAEELEALGIWKGSYGFLRRPGIEDQWVDVLEGMDAIQTPEELAAFLEGGQCAASETPPPEVDQFASDVLAAMGFGALPHRMVERSYSSLTDERYRQVWSVLAYADEQQGYGLFPFVRLHVSDWQDTPKLTRIATNVIALEPSLHPITEEQQQTAKDAAVSFCETYALLRNQPGEAVKVSGMSFAVEGIEAYAYVWIYDFADKRSGPVAEMSESRAENIGLQLAISIDTGAVFSLRAGVPESDFWYAP